MHRDALHVTTQIQPKTWRDEWYYRIKESYRDLTGRVRSRVMLNVGFIGEDHRLEDVRDIGKCLTYLYEHHFLANQFYVLASVSHVDTLYLLKQIIQSDYFLEYTTVFIISQSVCGHKY